MDDAGRRFSEAEVDAILRRAVARQEGGQALSKAELADVLRQLNLDESVLDEAIAEEDAERAVAVETAAWTERRRRAVTGHAATFASVMTLLVAINLLVTPHLLWFVWPLLGWGFGLLADWRRYRLGPDPSELASRRRQEAERAERAARKSEKAQRKARKREADEAVARASEELRDAVDGVALGVVGRGGDLAFALLREREVFARRRRAVPGARARGGGDRGARRRRGRALDRRRALHRRRRGRRDDRDRRRGRVVDDARRAEVEHHVGDEGHREQRGERALHEAGTARRSDEVGVGGVVGHQRSSME